MRLKPRLAGMFILAVFSLFVSSGAQSQDHNFYKGKTVRIVVGLTPCVGEKSHESTTRILE